MFLNDNIRDIRYNLEKLFYGFIFYFDYLRILYIYKLVVLGILK